MCLTKFGAKSKACGDSDSFVCYPQTNCGDWWCEEPVACVWCRGSSKSSFVEVTASFFQQFDLDLLGYNFVSFLLFDV